MSQHLDGLFSLCILLSVQKNHPKIMDQLSVFDVNTLKTLWSHWLGPDTPCSSEVQEGENKFSEVVEKQVFVKNVVYSKRGGKYFYFDF